VQVELLGQLADRFALPERFQHHIRLEGGGELPTVSFVHRSGIQVKPNSFPVLADHLTYLR
jgi:hypothetical protein